MAIYYHTQGIVLGKIARDEASRVIELFTRDFGKLSIWAISERKITSKLRGGLEPFSVAEIEFVQGRHKKILTEARSIARNEGVRMSLESLQCAWRIQRTMRFMREESPDLRIWHLLISVFTVLDKYRFDSTRYELVYQWFAWNIIAELGYRPGLKECTQCGRQISEVARIYFSFERGSVMCQTCAQERTGVQGAKEELVLECPIPVLDALTTF